VPNVGSISTTLPEMRDRFCATADLLQQLCRVGSRRYALGFVDSSASQDSIALSILSFPS